MAETDNVWNLPTHVEKLARDVSVRFSTKHGMLASVPLMCRGVDCPYRATCTIENDNELPRGHRCPIEIGAIMSRFEHWCNHFGIRIENGLIDDGDLVDATLIRDLVDNEIQTLRAENRIAISADFIAKTIAAVDKKCQAHHNDDISPEATYKMSLLDKKFKILQLLNSTRKDKSGNKSIELTPSQQAISIFNQIQEKLSKQSEDKDNG